METLECGHKESPHSDCTTGYGTDDKGNRYCYACCADRDVKAMQEDGRYILYLTNDGATNWPGSLKFPVRGTRTSRHNIAGKRYDVWFNGPDGHVWHGVQYGDMTQLLHCKRTTEVVR